MLSLIQHWLASADMCMMPIQEINYTLAQGIFFKTHHYIILFVHPLDSKPRMESYYSSSTDQLSW